MKVGDLVRISPDVTRQSDWILGRVLEVKNNSFVGVVIVAETEDGDVFFDREDMFQRV